MCLAALYYATVTIKQMLLVLSPPYFSVKNSTVNYGLEMKYSFSLGSTLKQHICT